MCVKISVIWKFSDIESQTARLRDQQQHSPINGPISCFSNVCTTNYLQHRHVKFQLSWTTSSLTRPQNHTARANAEKFMNHPQNAAPGSIDAVSHGDSWGRIGHVSAVAADEKRRLLRSAGIVTHDL